MKWLFLDRRFGFSPHRFHSNTQLKNQQFVFSVLIIDEHLHKRKRKTEANDKLLGSGEVEKSGPSIKIYSKCKHFQGIPRLHSSVPHLAWFLLAEERAEHNHGCDRDDQDGRRLDEREPQHSLV